MSCNTLTSLHTGALSFSTFRILNCITRLKHIPPPPQHHVMGAHASWISDKQPDASSPSSSSDDDDEFCVESVPMPLVRALGEGMDLQCLSGLCRRGLFTECYFYLIGVLAILCMNATRCAFAFLNFIN